MASQTETLTVGDIVLYEASDAHCRKEGTAKDGLIFAVGTCCSLDSTGDYIPCLAVGSGTNAVQTITPEVAAAVNAVQTITPSVATGVTEVQTVTITGLAAGVVRIELTHPDTGTVYTTDELAHDATTAEIETELTATIGANAIAVSGTDIDAFVLTFDDADHTWNDRDVPLVRILMGDSATATAPPVVVKTTRGAGTICRGFYRLGIIDASGNKQWTPPIAHNASAANVSLACDDALGAVGVVVTGGGLSTPEALTCTFSGTGFASVPQPTLIEVDYADLVGCDDMSVVHTTVGAGAIRVDGSYRLGITDINGDLHWTYAIAANAPFADINTAIADALGTASLVVLSAGCVSTPTALVVEFSGTGYAGLPQSAIQMDLSDLPGCDECKVVHTTVGFGQSTDCDAIFIDAGVADTSALSADTTALFLFQGPCGVNLDNLTFPTGTGAAITTALAALGIKAMTESDYQTSL